MPPIEIETVPVGCIDRGALFEIEKCFSEGFRYFERYLHEAVGLFRHIGYADCSCRDGDDIRLSFGQELFIEVEYEPTAGFREYTFSFVLDSEAGDYGNGLSVAVHGGSGILRQLYVSAETDVDLFERTDERSVAYRTLIHLQQRFGCRQLRCT